MLECIGLFYFSNESRNKVLMTRLSESHSDHFEQGSEVSLGSLRPRRYYYYLAYAFELMLYAVRETFLHVDGFLFGIPADTVIYVGHILASLIIMLLWSERFRGLVRLSVVMLVCGFVPFLLFPASPLRLLFGLLAMTGLGAAVTCARCGYAFASNNTERLVGIILMTVVTALIYLLKALGAGGASVSVWLPLALVAALAWCLLRFREEDLEAKKEHDKSDARGLYWALAFMIVYFGIDGYIYKLIDKNDRVAYSMFCLGIILAAVIFFVMMVMLKLHVWHLWALFFTLAVIMSVLSVLTPQMGTLLPKNLFCGLSIIGWPLSLYMLACAQRRFASYKLLKQCTIVFVILSPITTMSDDLLTAYYPEHMPVIALFYILVMLSLYLLTLPYSFRSLFSAVWISDLSYEDMSRLQERVKVKDRFSGWELTPRQKEVAALMLAAKTRRQIASELGLSESTVKTHMTELYRKLGISSKAELFRLFGTKETDSADSPKCPS